MHAGKGKATWAARCWLGLVLGCLAGCAAGNQQLDQALLADKPRPARKEDVREHYGIGFPDVVEVRVEGHPALDTRCRVAADGRIDLGTLGRPRVEGKTAAEAARLIAERAEVPAERVHVRVAECISQQIYVVGQVAGSQRAVPYQGPEKVAELLQRVGGLTPGSAVGDIEVLRPHVLDGRQPEVFRVDLEAIVLKHEERTNVVLQPFDQVFIGQTRPSSLEKLVPPWLQPLYKAVWGLSWPGSAKEAAKPAAPPAK